MGSGTAIDSESRVWFSVANGILDEIYHPFIDRATTRDFGFLVADGRDFFSEEKRDANHEIRPLAQGAPGFRLINTCQEGRYRITKTIVTDPRRAVLLQHLRFEALQGQLADYTLYALLNPHIGNHAMGNDGWAGDLEAQAREAKLLSDAAVQNLIDAQNTISRDVRIAWQDAQTARERLDVTAQLIQTAGQEEQLANARYRLGTSSIVEFVQAQLNETQARLQDASARYDFKSGRALLNFTIGQNR